MAKLQPVRGTRDIWGGNAKRFSEIVKWFSRFAIRYGFEEIQTPIFEYSEIFTKGLGETTDVVSKEMYDFQDKKGESLTLRPEATAGIARAYIFQGMQQKGVVKLFSHGPMFRYERPQKGRYRQFYQLDAEIIGPKEPHADVEIIAFAYQLLKKLKIEHKIILHLNSLGDTESRVKYRDALRDYLLDHSNKLSKYSEMRVHRNPLRILDSKDESDKALLTDAPKFSQYLNQYSQDFFAQVKEGLNNLGIHFHFDEHLVRGLDYYCHTAFEFKTRELGTQDAVLGGGRYDGLMQMMGGKPAPGTGWAAGIDRLAELINTPSYKPTRVEVIPVEEIYTNSAATVCYYLRERRQYITEMAYRGNERKRYEKANEKRANWVVLVDARFQQSKQVEIKNLRTGFQTSCNLNQIIDFISPKKD